MPADKPKTPRPPTRKRWRMPTGTFVQLWNDAINRDAENDWREFVLACWAVFSTTPSNQEVLVAEGFTNTGPDAAYEWLSEKAYAKATTIRRKLKKETGTIVMLPHGYRDRPGRKKAEVRLSWHEIAAMFTP